ncbi:MULTISPECIES: hemolysin family protein [Glutamicibacter]|uniref:Possible CBS domain-containing transporter n=2 Tax=Glutamicibacter arilaitensis TaxID=256701 RepID=A0ABP1U8H1_GLUAR|nr:MULTISPECIES: hemolysin family protein [Glutamicibacter]CBT77408.1 possible CBS domain-containing transporter [Glutamicibacter arilaitensis Re117]HCH47518.1 HlyC/CorC family transporter [Glutamicibacter sp.]
MEWISLGIAIILILGCGLFVAAEFSLITVNRSQVKQAAEKGDRRAAGVLKGMSTLSTQLSGAQLGITLTNLGIGFLAEPAIAALVVGPLQDFGLNQTLARSVSIGIALVLATILTMVFGELIPKNLAIAKPFATAKAVVGFQRGFSVVTKPFLAFFNGNANWIVRRFGIEPQEELASTRSAEELVALVGHSAREGLLPSETAEMLRRTVAFGNRRAHDVMTVRSRMITVTAQETVHEVLELAARTGHSRFPLVDEGGHRVLGMVHIRALLAIPYAQRQQSAAGDSAEDAFLVPDTIELDELMDQMRNGGLQLAVLIDETGDVAGMLTLEDLVEEIVGEVRDEHDPEDSTIQVLSGNSWRLDAALRPDEANELLGCQIPEDSDYETLAGLLTVQLGKFGEVGDVVRLVVPGEPGGPHKELEFTIHATDGQRIASVDVTVSEQAEGEDAR